jgi:hypothetical protein
MKVLVSCGKRFWKTWKPGRSDSTCKCYFAWALVGELEVQDERRGTGRGNDIDYRCADEKKSCQVNGRTLNHSIGLDSLFQIISISAEKGTVKFGNALENIAFKDAVWNVQILNLAVKLSTTDRFLPFS